MGSLLLTTGRSRSCVGDSALGAGALIVVAGAVVVGTGRAIVVVVITSHHVDR